MWGATGGGCVRGAWCEAAWCEGLGMSGVGVGGLDGESSAYGGRYERARGEGARFGGKLCARGPGTREPWVRGPSARRLGVRRPGTREPRAGGSERVSSAREGPG